MSKEDVKSKFLSPQGVPCDLVTGEERTFVDAEGGQAEHVACTIEMCSVTTPCQYLTLSLNLLNIFNVQ
jgi:hypothetical protein